MFRRWVSRTFRQQFTIRIYENRNPTIGFQEQKQTVLNGEINKVKAINCIACLCLISFERQILAG